MFQNSVCSNIAEFYAFLKKIKNANTGHYVRHVWKNTSFLFYAFFLTCFVFFAADFMEVGSSEVKFVGRKIGWLGASKFCNLYLLEDENQDLSLTKTYVRAIFIGRSLRL